MSSDLHLKTILKTEFSIVDVRRYTVKPFNHTVTLRFVKYIAIGEVCDRAKTYIDTLAFKNKGHGHYNLLVYRFR